MIYKEILRGHRLVYFIVIVAIVICCSLYINVFILSDALVYATYSERLSIEQMEGLLSMNKGFAWFSYLLIPVAILMKMLYNAFCLYMGTFLKEKYGTFGDLFHVTLKAELIFCFALVVKIVFYELFLKIKNLDDLNFVPFSLQHFLFNAKYPKWVTYPLQTANVFEVFYMLLIAKLISVDKGLSFDKCIRFTALSYFTGLLFWVLIVVYLNMLVS